MRVQRFLLWITMTNERPKDISEMRWKAMLTWYDTRVKLFEAFTC